MVYSGWATRDDGRIEGDRWGTKDVVLDISKLQPGKYCWQINLMNANSGEIAAGKPDASGELEALDGPFFE